MRKKTILLATLLILVAACTNTLTPKPPEPVLFTVNSIPSGASVSLSSGETCTSPCQLQMASDKNFSVTVSKQGYKPTSVQIQAQLVVASKKGVQDIYRLNPNPLNIKLTPSWSKDLSSK